MKLKQLARFILAIALVAVVLGSATVFAPPSNLVFPSLVNTFVTNNGADEAVPVEDTNQLESLEVTVPDGVEITNVLGPQEGTLREIDVEDDITGSPRLILALNTEGYRDITILFYAEGNECRYRVMCHVGEEGDRSWFIQDWVDVGATLTEAVTCPIRGPWYEVWVHCRALGGLANATVYYYMTT